MKLEIRTKCSICETELKHLTERGVHETILFTDLCPTCHPPKGEKVTPGEGEMIEVRDECYEDDYFDTRRATGTRSEGGRLMALGQVIDYPDLPWHQWRYPGEKEWRD